MMRRRGDGEANESAGGYYQMVHFLEEAAVLYRTDCLIEAP
jgi:hypothetical protein